MIRIALIKSPNQKLNFFSEGNNFEIAIKTCVNIMALDITVNRKRILSGIRACANTPIIPFNYLKNGNLVFLCLSDDYPFYTQFGVSQILLYATAQEIEAFNAGN